MTPVNKDKIAKMVQIWRLLPPNHEFWQFFDMASCLGYILGHRQKFHENNCKNEEDMNQFAPIL